MPYSLTIEPVSVGHLHQTCRVVIVDPTGKKAAELMEYVTATHPGWRPGIWHWPYPTFKSGDKPPYSKNARVMLAKLNR